MNGSAGVNYAYMSGRRYGERGEHGETEKIERPRGDEWRCGWGGSVEDSLV